MLVSLFWTHCNLYYKYLLIKTFSFVIYHEKKIKLVSQLKEFQNKKKIALDYNTFSIIKCLK